jgi:hypothetical protein
MSDNTIVRVTVNKKTGKMEIKIVGHENNASCSLADDHELVTKLAKNIGSITDRDNTDEYYQELYNTKVSKGYNSADEESEEKKKSDKISLGFGV